MFTLNNLLFIFVTCYFSRFASANWDEATGHIRDYTPSKSWLKSNRPQLCNGDIQVSECARNTRLHYPNVQLFATFKVNHADDNYHGCPYGVCCAYTVIPSPKDMVADFTNSHVFFWHNLGGIPGLGTNPIRDSQTGRAGYETSNGVFHEGNPDYSRRENGHDSNYPGFKLPTAWGSINYPQVMKNKPAHPKCGVPTGPNRDPGEVAGGSKKYTPSPASAYLPPPAKLVA